jgi:hypothetical protein
VCSGRLLKPRLFSLPKIFTVHVPEVFLGFARSVVGKQEVKTTWNKTNKHRSKKEQEEEETLKRGEADETKDKQGNVMHRAVPGGLFDNPFSLLLPFIFIYVGATSSTTDIDSTSTFLMTLIRVNASWRVGGGLAVGRANSTCLNIFRIFGRSPPFPPFSCTVQHISLERGTQDTVCKMDAHFSVNPCENQTTAGLPLQASYPNYASYSAHPRKAQLKSLTSEKY